MKPFEPVFQRRPWVSGSSALSLYVLPAPAVDTELFDLVAECRTALQEYPIWCLPDDLIHITIEIDAWATSEHISASQRTRLISALTARLAGLDPFTVLCGSPIANRSEVAA